MKRPFLASQVGATVFENCRCPRPVKFISFIIARLMMELICGLRTGTVLQIRRTGSIQFKFFRKKHFVPERTKQRIMSIFIDSLFHQFRRRYQHYVHHVTHVFRKCGSPTTMQDRSCASYHMYVHELETCYQNFYDYS